MLVALKQQVSCHLAFTRICSHWDCIIKLCKYWHTSNKKIGKRDDKNKLYKYI